MNKRNFGKTSRDEILRELRLMPFTPLSRNTYELLLYLVKILDLLL